MGLDIRPGGARWSYSGFMAFREKLAEAEGLVLREMDGFGGEKSWDRPDGEPVTPLKPLLFHSDCDGFIDGWDCEEMLPRLRWIIDRWDSRDPVTQYDVAELRKLVDGMQHCADHGCALVFS